jgi:simple sugar transport system substrate-binding protein/ribose transport system substrate-binding protein
MLRRKAVAIATAGIASVLLAGCGGSSSSAPPADDAGSSTPTPAATGALAGFELADYIKEHVSSGATLKFVYITNDLSSSYTAAQKAGVDKATADLGVAAELQGPPTGKAEDQVSLIQTLIAQKQVDGIVVAAVNVDSLKPVIQQAFDAGIPFVSAFTNQPNSKQLAFVGADNTAFGKEEGQKLAALLEGKKGKVVAISVDTAAGWSKERMDGLQQGLADNPGLEFVGPINTGIEPAQMYNAIQNAMTANPNAVAIASVDCCSIVGAAKWVEKEGKSGEVAVIGTDALQNTLDYIKKGTIAFSLSQDPVGQVYNSISMIKDYLENGTPPETTIMPALLVDKSNADTTTPEG